MARRLGRGATTVVRVFLVSLLLVPLGAAALAIMYDHSSYSTGRNITYRQPVPFSHQHHVGGLGLDCRYCHTGVETSPVAGVPPTETCMTCHSQLWTNAEMLAPVRQSLAKGEPLRWHRVHRLPGYVYFDHSVHIAKGVGCSSCHGAVETMPLIRQHAPLTMGWCLDCHRHPAQALRPKDKVFDQSWQPPDKQLEEGKGRLQDYLIKTQHLTDCSVCHR
jgi:hypothetical protein